MIRSLTPATEEDRHGGRVQLQVLGILSPITAFLERVDGTPGLIPVMAKRRAMDRVRKSRFGRDKIRREVALPSDFDRPISEVPDVANLQDAMSQLPKPEAALLHLTAWEGVPQTAIASMKKTKRYVIHRHCKASIEQLKTILSNAV